MFIHGFGRQGREAKKNEGRVVGSLSSCDSKVILPAGWVRRCSARDGAEIWHEAQDALGLAAFERNWVSVRVNGLLGIALTVQVSAAHTLRGWADLGGVTGEVQIIGPDQAG